MERVNFSSISCRVQSSNRHTIGRASEMKLSHDEYSLYYDIHLLYLIVAQTLRM
jgi:hypothetical protein